MSQTSTERLRDYLVQLPPQSQALLMREFERAIERGEDTTVASFVLEQLRKVVRGNDDEAQPRTNDPARLLFRPLEPFLVEANFPVRPGQVRRASLVPVWQWLIRDGAPDQAREFEAVLNRVRKDGTTSDLEPAIRKLQLAAADAILKIASPVPGGDRQRSLARVGPPDVIADLLPIALVLQAREALDTLAEHLKTLHDGVRGLRTELDLRNDSTWGKQLTSIRADISNALQSEIDSVPGRVRRLLRQRADKDIAASARLDPSEVDETTALIDFVAVCRTYVSELAINEVTLRTYSDLQHYVEHSTEALVQSLRAGDAKARAYRQMQVAAAIRFCDVLFGHDYASLMSRAAENAMTGERKPSRAG